MATFPRISARTGQPVDLNVDFFNAGVLADPFAIRQIKVYKTAVLPHNLVATIPVVGPAESDYPAPVTQETEAAEAGDCCTEPTAATAPVVGRYHLYYSIPADFSSPDVYFDVWEWFATDPCGQLGTEGTDCDVDAAVYDDLLQRCCHRFWVYPDAWFCDDGLQTVRFGFEPLDVHFQTGEVRPLEVGLMPLPLYDYNYNLVNPLMPLLQPTITVETQHGELLVDRAAATMKLRQGSYRSNPYVVSWLLDTARFLRGTYQYRIRLPLPNGQVISSGRFHFTVR